MAKNRNKHSNSVPNPYRLRIDEVKYNIGNKRIECVIRYVNPITNNLQISKGVASCNPEDVFDVEVGKHLAEGRAKYNMYRGYREYIDNVLNNVYVKYDKLLKREAVHIQDVINEL